jgi:hypothetical protein
MFSFPEKVLSPVKSIVTPSFRDGLEVFHFSQSLSEFKTTGVSPNGKTTIPLKKFEGMSHNRVRNKDNPQLIISGDSPIKSPFKVSNSHQTLRLEAILIDLKNRADGDFFTFKAKGEVDSNHFTASINKIEACIKQIKKCAGLGSNKENLLNELNNYIRQGTIYNPFSLKKLYSNNSYQFSLAQGDFNQPIDAEDLFGERPAKRKLNLNISLEEIHLEKNKKRERPLDKNSFFVPRSVKLKMKHEAIQNTDVQMGI